MDCLPGGLAPGVRKESSLPPSDCSGDTLSIFAKNAIFCNYFGRVQDMTPQVSGLSRGEDFALFRPICPTSQKATPRLKSKSP
jgi:hypothetical protein